MRTIPERRPEYKTSMLNADEAYDRSYGVNMEAAKDDLLNIEKQIEAAITGGLWTCLVPPVKDFNFFVRRHLESLGYACNYTGRGYDIRWNNAPKSLK